MRESELQQEYGASSSSSAEPLAVRPVTVFHSAGVFTLPFHQREDSSGLAKSPRYRAHASRRDKAKYK